MTARELINLLRKNGWPEVAQSGSHLKLRKLGEERPIIVPIHSGDLKTGTLNAILKQAGLK